MLALDQAMEILEQVRPAETWDNQDDLCDCTFQRIGYWHNPYIGEVLEVRMCCIWKELYKQFPEFVRVTKHAPAEWNGETEMPKSIWVRQLANLYGVPVSEVRASAPVPPQGQARREKPHVFLPFGGEYMEVLLG